MGDQDLGQRDALRAWHHPLSAAKKPHDETKISVSNSIHMK